MVCPGTVLRNRERHGGQELTYHSEKGSLPVADSAREGNLTPGPSPCAARGATGLAEATVGGTCGCRFCRNRGSRLPFLPRIEKSVCGWEGATGGGGAAGGSVARRVGVVAGHERSKTDGDS